MSQLFMNKPMALDIIESATLTGSQIAANDLALVFDRSADAWKLKSLGGGNTNTLTVGTYEATVTVANGQTTGQEAAIGMPNNFLPLAVGIHVTVAATNAVSLTDIGDEGDTDSYVDTISVAVNATGFKGIFACNGLRGLPGGTANTGALGTADEVMCTLGGDPGATGATIRFTFIGITGA
jgi:hypothetical protein